MSNMSSVMITHSGTAVSTEHGVPMVKDIARSLGRLPRWTGHSHLPWNVAQHSLLVAELLQICSAEMELYGLLHDAHESLTGDIATPWKTSDIRQLQTAFDARIYESFGLEPPSFLVAERVKAADTQALVVEAMFLCHPKTIDHLLDVDGFAPPSDAALRCLKHVWNRAATADAGYLWLKDVTACMGMVDPLWRAE